MPSILESADAMTVAAVQPGRLLRVNDLRVHFHDYRGSVAAVRGVSLHVDAGECLGIVGESGAGKSQVLMAVMNLQPANAAVTGEIDFIGPARSRGRGRVAMVFQDPMTSLTPHMRVGDQVAEALVVHRGLAWTAARAEAVRLLERVRLAAASQRAREYPHELSGGMRQRVMIAIALACDPAVLLADEPTTALDVTIQAQILALLLELKQDGLGVILVTHDLGVIAGVADRVAVMYAGRIVECGSVTQILREPGHPYTQALLRSMPRLDSDAGLPLKAIEGQPPAAGALPEGCAFSPRCAYVRARCGTETPPFVELRSTEAAGLACHYPLQGGGR